MSYYSNNSNDKCTILQNKKEHEKKNLEIQIESTAHLCWEGEQGKNTPVPRRRRARQNSVPKKKGEKKKSKKNKKKSKQKEKKTVLRLVCLSDTHTKHHEIDVPSGDILIHTGDFTTRGPISQVEDFNNWLGKQPHQYKIVIAGNHEMSLNPLLDEPLEIQKLLFNCYYLQDSMVEIEGIKIYGTPWIARKPVFLNSRACRWAFGEVGSMGLAFAFPSGGKELLRRWEDIPTDTDILLTHLPPHGILDGFAGKHTGCPMLAQNVIERVAPALHIFGHVHGAYGVSQQDKTVFINAANFLPNNRAPICLDYNIINGKVKLI